MNAIEGIARVSQHDRSLTQLLLDWSEGDLAARDELMPLVNDELRMRARAYLAQERISHTLQPTALVNEVYLKLVDRRRVAWKNRAHFFGFAAQSMRRILVDHARVKRAAKRGSGLPKISIEDAGDVAGERGVDLVALDDALEALGALNARQAKVVELRYFAGLSIQETAEVLGVSSSLVSAEWSLAKAWLYRELRGA